MSGQGCVHNVLVGVLVVCVCGGCVGGDMDDVEYSVMCMIAHHM